MKREGRITMLINRDFTHIEIEDDKANTTFVKIKLTPEQLSAILSRQAYVECELDINGLERVGKTHHNEVFQFEIPDSIKERGWENRDIYYKELTEYAQALLDKENQGWIVESYFGTQTSFFKVADKRWAKCTIRRWL